MPSTTSHEPVALDDREFPVHHELPVKDSELVEQVLSGTNRAAFKTLMERHRARVKQHIGEFIPLADQEDVEQEIWTEVSQFLHKVKADFPGWLGAITNTHCIKRMEKQKHDPLNQTEQLTDEIEELEDFELGPSQTSRLRRLEVGMAQLSKEQQELLSLSITLDSLDEIAKSMDLPKETVKNRLYRSRKRLRQILEKSDTPDSV